MRERDAPWEERTVMPLRAEFVRLALPEGANIQALCRRLGIDRKTTYKWLQWTKPRSATPSTPPKTLTVLTVFRRTSRIRA